MTLLILVLIAFFIYYLSIYRNHFGIKNINAQFKCPSCGSKIEKEFNVCPICKESLKKPCHNCGEIIEVHWNYCPYCENRIKKGDRN